MLFPYTSAASDELELTPGDFLYVKQSDVIGSDDGWAEGLSWLTGCSGVFPLIYSERTAETETWTMHMWVIDNDLIFLVGVACCGSSGGLLW